MNQKEKPIPLRIPRAFLSLPVLCLLAFALMATACGEKPRPSQKPEMHLVVSPKFREIFPHLQASYQQSAMQALFADMSKRSDRVCRLLHDKIPGRFEVFKTFSPELWTPKFNALLSEIIAGCYNFFTMNDLAANLALEKVAGYFPGKKDCYAVGFVQIYMMHSILNCNKLGMIDVDWRILHLQQQALAQFAEGKPLNFKNLDVRWSANFGDNEKIRPRESGLTADSFCYHQNRPACRVAFQKFQQLFGGIRQIEMQLSFLHDIRLQPLSETSVVYVSNAVDPGYTKKEQFDTMLQNLARVQDKDHKTAIVYHGGGSHQFAIYQVSQSEKGDIVVDTKCRDDLEWSKYYRDRPGKKYQTYFDAASINPKPPRCSV